MFDLFWVLVIAAIGVALIVSIFSGSNSDKTTTAPPPPRVPRTLKRVPPARRKRLSGGYYPAGYTGSYHPGEDLVDGLIVLAMINAMTDQERLDYGEGDYIGEWQEYDADEVVEETSYDADTEEVVAETEEYTAIDTDTDDDIRTTWGGDDSDSGFGGGDDSDSFGGFDD